jgi:hypothetical protein
MIEADALVGVWFGDLFGTSHGPTFVEIKQGDAGLSIEGRVNFANQITVFNADAVKDPSKPISISLHLFQSPADVSGGTLTVTDAAATAIFGQWATEVGGKGIFRLAREPVNAPVISKPSDRDEELIASSVVLGPIELFRSDLTGLIEKMQSFFPEPIRANLVMSTDQGYKEARSQFVSVFMKSASLPASVNNLKLQLTDTSTSIHHVAIVEFNRNGTTSILVQSGDRIWTHGAREALESHLRRHESWFKKLVFNEVYSINALIFTVALIFLPDMTLLQRIPFMILALFGLALALWMQRRLRTNIIWLDETKRDNLRSYRANISIALMSVGIGAAISLLAAFVQLYWPKWFP